MRTARPAAPPALDWDEQGPDDLAPAPLGWAEPAPPAAVEATDEDLLLELLDHVGVLTELVVGLVERTAAQDATLARIEAALAGALPAAAPAPARPRRARSSS